MSSSSDAGPSQEGADYEEDIFKVPLLPGGNSREAIPEDRRGERLPIPEEGEIGWGSAPTFEPWEDMGWEADESQRLRISNNCMTATVMLEMTCVAVMGERTFSTGLHAWTVIIEVGAAPCPPSPPSPPSSPASTSISPHLRRVHLFHRLHLPRLVDTPHPTPPEPLPPHRTTTPPQPTPSPLPAAPPSPPPKYPITPTLSLVPNQVSRLNYGGAICIGVTDADPKQERRDNRGGWSCGFNPYCGAFFVTGDAYKVNYSTPAHDLMNGDLQGKANKATVTVMVRTTTYPEPEPNPSPDLQQVEMDQR